MKYRILPVLACLVMMFSGQAHAQNGATVNSTYSQNFVQKAAAGNLFEILSSQIALEKSKNEKVREFAQKMITDHTKAGNDLKAAMEKANATDAPLTAPAETLDPAHQQILDTMKAASSDLFDAKYIDAQVSAHNEAIRLFQGYKNDGVNTALKDFAEMTLPVLEAHKQHIDALAKTM
jgi:putative membrane protein